MKKQQALPAMLAGVVLSVTAFAIQVGGGLPPTPVGPTIHTGHADNKACNCNSTQPQPRNVPHDDSIGLTAPDPDPTDNEGGIYYAGVDTGYKKGSTASPNVMVPGGKCARTTYSADCYVDDDEGLICGDFSFDVEFIDC